jgi:hypothetical protein
MNNKRFLAGGLLLAASAFAYADPVTWKFEFLGLNALISSYPDSSTSFTGTLSGLITGEDRNHDNLIDKSELSSLTIGNDGISGNFAICDTWAGDVDHHCRLDRFVFAPGVPAGPALDITGSWVDVDERQLSWRTMEITTGDHYAYDIYKYQSGRYGWTPQTTLRITQVSPVPEPEGGGMLVAGLLGIAAVRRALARRV